MKYPEKNRIEGLDNEDGVFLINHNKISNYYYFCIVSSGYGWEHVSVTLRKREGNYVKDVKRSCTWLEMCFIKSVFWRDEQTVMQLHPPKSDWVSTHPYCLHLWRPIGKEIPRPPSILVANKGDNIQS